MRHTTTELKLRVRDSAESTVETGNRTGRTWAGMTEEDATVVDSFTAAWWDLSWNIKITDKTVIMADSTPIKDRTIKDLWLYLSAMFLLKMSPEEWREKLPVSRWDSQVSPRPYGPGIAADSFPLSCPEENFFSSIWISAEVAGRPTALPEHVIGFKSPD